MKQIDDALTAVKDYLGSDCPNYSSMLKSSMKETEPVFLRKGYIEFFTHCAATVSGWTPRVLVESSLAESQGSSRLFEIWKAVDYNREAEDGILKHVKDESYHSRLFLKVVELGSPNFLSGKENDEIEKQLFSVNNQNLAKSALKMPEDVLIDYMIQINLAEIRTLINVHIIAPIFLYFTPKGNKEKVQKIFSSLQRDEITHIGYTANLIENWSSGKNQKRIANLFHQNLIEFNQLSITTSEAAVKSYGQNKFPDLLDL